jgi:hypothetical protein
MQKALYIVTLLLLSRALVLTDSPKEIGRTNEKELKVVVSASFGTLVISRGESGKIVTAEPVVRKGRTPPMVVEYSIRNRVGYLELHLGERHEDDEEKKHTGSFGGHTWNVQFTDGIPISFDIELGMGKGTFNLSGLQVKDLNISTGASDVTLSFDEVNKNPIDVITIESGVSKFVAENLGNANFKRLRFEGGVGAYTLDFTGAALSEADVDVEVGLGVLTMIIPDDVGARLYYVKSWISRLEWDRDFSATGENQYQSDNYVSSQKRMNIRVDSGLGSVKVRRK